MLICVGPADGEVTGQSECLKKIESSYLDTLLISNGGEGISFIHKIFLALLAVFRLIFAIFANRDSKVLFSVSRSPKGFIKDLPIFIICYIMNINVFLHIHGNDIASLFESKFLCISKLAKFFYSKACTIIVPNSFMLSQFSKFPNVYKRILPNFHDLDETDYIHTRNEGIDKIKLLYLSGVMVDKGIFDVFSCYEYFSGSTDKIELHIAGPMKLGPEDKMLFFKKLEQLGGFYYGTIEGKKKSKLLSEADILVFPSKYQTEASPLVVLEAMSMDSAILVYSHNNIESVLPLDTYQYQVIQDYSFNQLVFKLQKLMNDKSILDFCKKKNRIEAQKYTLSCYISGLKEIIEDMSK